jgi:hypothetical protein
MDIYAIGYNEQAAGGGHQCRSVQDADLRVCFFHVGDWLVWWFVPHRLTERQSDFRVQGILFLKVGLPTIISQTRDSLWNATMVRRWRA